MPSRKARFVMIVAFFVVMGGVGEALTWGLSKYGHLFFIGWIAAALGIAAIYDWRRRRAEVEILPPPERLDG